MTTAPLAPTTDAIDEWLARDEALRRSDGTRHAADGSYGVDIKTKASRWRYITSSVMHNGEKHYWTIAGEGSSNGSREYTIPASAITEARGHYLPRY